MKKLVLIASAITVMSLASCNKERTCTCTEDGETTVYVVEANKADAKDWCEGNLTVISIDGDKLEEDEEVCELD